MLNVQTNNTYRKITKHFVSSLKWISDNITFKTSKIGFYIGGITAAVLMIFTIINYNSFIELNFETRWLLLFCALILPLIIGASMAYTLVIKSEMFNRAFHISLIFLLPLVSITMTECLNSIFVYDMTVLGFIANYVFVLLLYFLVFALSGSVKLSILIVNVILYGFAISHCYIVYFRGTPFLPMDFSGIRTGMNVAGSYDLKFLYNAIIGTYLFILLIVFGFKTKTPQFNSVLKIALRSFMGAFFVALMFIFYFTSILADAGVRPDFWNQSRGYKNYGFAFSFFCNTKYLYMTVPNGYTADDIDDYVSEKVQSDEQTVKTPKSAPNIICIMNESLSDLKILGDFETNEDYMPFMHSLEKNTIKGNLYVPVVGAGTSNTEFEFLTGNSVAFLPSGSNAYMLYVKNPMASLVSTLEAQGYSSFAFHPYYASGWNRISVYDYFGFNSFFSLENIIDSSILEEYSDSGNINYLQALVDQYYPDRKNMLLRQYISDSYDYRLIIEDFEKRDKEKPYFIFNVTMQNHGGYTNSAKNFDRCIKITSSDDVTYKKANNYLSLVKASDNAFKELIDYFKNVKEPTLICMFGDHQPSVEQEFISSIMGVDSLSSLTLEQDQLRHATPFYIWANYDIKEQYIEKLSSNYLAAFLIETAGLNNTEYNKYLLNLSKSLPVVDTVGYIDSEDNYYRWSDDTPYSEMLKKYEKIQYNYIFDNENKKSDMFYINGFTIEPKYNGGTE
ncbi:MAG: sulfatase-like hydrolase/transferase [Clostridia bacterium]|nr:sulfatase-like hydrolase/transferase [Clostridia bacterium]